MPKKAGVGEWGGANIFLVGPKLTLTEVPSVLCPFTGQACEQSKTLSLSSYSLVP